MQAMRGAMQKKTAPPMAPPLEGLASWLLQRLKRGRQSEKPRLALLERINLAPRQSLALVEAEGRRFLVVTSPEGAPAFLALDDASQSFAAPQPASELHSCPVHHSLPHSGRMHSAAPVRPETSSTARVSW